MPEGYQLVLIKEPMSKMKIIEIARWIKYSMRPKLFTKQLEIPVIQMGTEYGGFRVATSVIDDKHPVIYSFGVGEDISFDLECIKILHAEVYAFDPTPKSISWVENQKIPDNFHFAPYGLGKIDGVVKFYLPKIEAYVSGSSVKMDNLKTDSINVQMHKFSTIVNQYGHKRIDILKMDVEGSEYEVMPEILESGVKIQQICLEVHGRYMDNGENKSKKLLKLLNDYGYKVADVSLNQEEILFIKTVD